MNAARHGLAMLGMANGKLSIRAEVEALMAQISTSQQLLRESVNWGEYRGELLRNAWETCPEDFVEPVQKITTAADVRAAIDRAQEEAAWTLGASRRRTFTRVILPMITPAIVSGALLSFARALGDTVAVMDSGRVVHHGTMSALAGDEALQQSLLGLDLGAGQAAGYRSNRQ